MKNLWIEIKEEIKNISPKTYNSFNSGATQKEIDRLERELQVSLPEDFKTYLSVVNGQKHDDYEHTFMGYNCLLCVDEIISTWKMMNDLFADEEPIEDIKENKIKALYWSPFWVPFSDFEASNRWILDLDPAANGTYGQIFSYYPGFDSESDEAVEAQSFREFSMKILQTLKNKNFVLEDGVIEVDW